MIAGGGKKGGREGGRKGGGEGVGTRWNPSYVVLLVVQLLLPGKLGRARNWRGPSEYGQKREREVQP